MNHLLRYLSATRDFGLYYPPPKTRAVGGLRAYVDADYYGDDERSYCTAGFYIILGGAVIDYGSKRIKSSVTSTAGQKSWLGVLAARP